MTRLRDGQEAEVNDHVRVKATWQIGWLIRNTPRTGRVLVELQDGTQVRIANGEYTNLSLSARRGHATSRVRTPGTPNPRGAGRKPSPYGPHTRMVSLRLDAECWRRLGAYVTSGRLRTRSQAINDMLAELVHQLDLEGR